MLTRLDDYPVHQTAEPLAHPSTGDRNFYDRYFFNGYVRDGSLFFAVAFGLYPNRRVMDAAVGVVLPSEGAGGRQYALHASRLAPLERTETAVGPIAIDVLEPMRRLRVRVASNEHGIEGEATFVARSPAIEEPRFSRRSASGRLTMDLTRFAQLGAWEGWVAAGGRRFDLAPGTVWGSRDRSWGVRGVGEPEGGAPAGGTPQFYWLWAPLNFDDRCAHFGTNEDERGRAWHLNAVVTEAQPDAAQQRMERAEHRVTWEPGTRRMQRAELAFHPAEGPQVGIELESLLHFQMLGIGYGHPEWGHGRWRGEHEVGGETWDLGTLDPMDRRHLHIQSLCRARMSGDGTPREGMGVLEQLVIGPHAPSGFTSMLDPASR